MRVPFMMKNLRLGCLWVPGFSSGYSYHNRNTESDFHPCCSACIVLVLYVVVGMALKYKLKEERGMNMILNLEFWMSFPGLVKVISNPVTANLMLTVQDGFLYTYNRLSNRF